MESGDSERKACRVVGINRTTFRAAALKVGAVGQYARALEAIAEGQVRDIEAAISETRDGKLDVQIARLEIDTRKWLASKLLPKRYGDKSQVDHTSSDGSMTPTIVQLVGPDANGTATAPAKAD
jgi:DNA-binding transcriptional regulator YdaS (Cro superfamily)